MGGRGGEGAGCTAPTFRGEAGDPIAMHHSVLPTTTRYSCTYATPSQLYFCHPHPHFLSSFLIIVLCRFRRDLFFLVR